MFNLSGDMAENLAEAGQERINEKTPLARWRRRPDRFHEAPYRVEMASTAWNGG